MINTERMEQSRAFKYFALEGATGRDRWKNAGDAFRHDLNTLSQVRSAVRRTLLFAVEECGRRVPARPQHPLAGALCCLQRKNTADAFRHDLNTLAGFSNGDRTHSVSQNQKPAADALMCRTPSRSFTTKGYDHKTKRLDVQETIPQHNYRLTAAALSQPRFGEVACRDYRESVLRELPHLWTQRTDTHMHAAHFAKHREARGAKKAELAHGSTGDAAGGGAGGTPGAGEKQGDAKRAHRASNVLVAHTQEGLDVVNLFTGTTHALAPPLS